MLARPLEERSGLLVYAFLRGESDQGGTDCLLSWFLLRYEILIKYQDDKLNWAFLEVTLLKLFSIRRRPAINFDESLQHLRSLKEIKNERNEEEAEESEVNTTEHESTTNSAILLTSNKLFSSKL